MKWFAKQPNEGMFREERAGRLHKTKGAIYGLLIGFAICSVLWFIFYSGRFDVQKVEIAPLQVLRAEAIEGEIGTYFNGPKKRPWGNRNIFSLNKDELKKYLMNKFFVNSVTVDKSYPNILRLKIIERQRSVVLITKNNMYVVDDYGVVTDFADATTTSITRQFLISPSPVNTPKEIYVITSVTTTYDKNQVFTDSTMVRKWLVAANKLRDAGIWFKALDIGLKPSDAISIILKENKNVLFEMDDTLDTQIETLRAFLASKPKLDQIYEYIDVRVPGKIYYK